MFLIYNLILIVVGILYFPRLCIKKKMHKGFLKRVGLSRLNISEEYKNNKTIWIHAVSVGEVITIVPLINEIINRFPEVKVVCSTVTKTGYSVAKEKLEDKVYILFAPLDFSWAVKRYINEINPCIYISTETEIWPNLYRFLNKRNVPIIQVNGRISDKAYVGYKRFKYFVSRILKNVSFFCMQSRLDSDRIIELGADKNIVKVIGNLKFDSLPVCSDMKKSDLGFSEDSLILIAGSTHPGEEDIIVETFMKLKPEFPNLNLIIAPRHIERTQDVIRIVEKMSLRSIRFSEIKDGNIAENKVVVVDTIGNLRQLYGLATVVFVGKSLTAIGGQNMIEPIFFGKPTFVGPNTQNFRNIVDMLKEKEVLFEVIDKKELLEGLRTIISDKNKMDAYSVKAKDVVDKLRGATERTADIIAGFVNK